VLNNRRIEGVAALAMLMRSTCKFPANIRITGAALIALNLALGGCDFSLGEGPDIRLIQGCAKQHPPPPEANVDRLGLLPVYWYRQAGSDDEATHQWFADMDACTGRGKAAK